ncbi:MAG: aldo/keto reductase [Tetrasphaera sp.]
MSTRTIGPEEFTTSAIGFGCMGLSQGYGPADDAESVAAIHAALDAGVTLIDTAMSYGEGANERLVGEALRSSGRAREETQLATKLGIMRTPSGVGLDADPARIRGYCEASLERLGVDRVDLYYLHRVDPRFPVEESIGAMGQLVADGLVGHIGVSEVTPEQLERAASVHPITAVQMEWSLMWREPETGIVPTARRLGVGLVPYSPLGRGLLSATLDRDAVAQSPFRAGDPRFNDAALTANATQVEALAALAAEWGLSAAQLALAWLLAQGPDVVPIPGSRRDTRVTENAAAMAVTLSPEQLARLDAAVPPAGWVGDRASFAVPVTARPAV